MAKWSDFVPECMRKSASASDIAERIARRVFGEFGRAGGGFTGAYAGMKGAPKGSGPAEKARYAIQGYRSGAKAGFDKAYGADWDRAVGNGLHGLAGAAEMLMAVPDRAAHFALSSSSPAKAIAGIGKNVDDAVRTYGSSKHGYGDVAPLSRGLAERMLLSVPDARYGDVVYDNTFGRLMENTRALHGGIDEWLKARRNGENAREIESEGRGARAMGATVASAISPFAIKNKIALLLAPLWAGKAMENGIEMAAEDADRHYRMGPVIDFWNMIRR